MRISDCSSDVCSSDLDLLVRAAQYVPLEIAIEICVARGHFRGDVLEAVSKALAAFFAPTNFAFGQPVYLSRLYAAVEAVEGVDSAHVTNVERYWESANGEKIGRASGRARACQSV